eukprot:TRINITY_DN10203_c0_g1_i1.p1 TRINITY_DN10203_c0_g1~~TRINITY_DN10203_c0_g1_i1.p1  ORF type:complete len:353 (+),score=29.48 TRINITY_DN10203_c0_g1_i1:404-1462(+)
MLDSWLAGRKTSGANALHAFSNANLGLGVGLGFPGGDPGVVLYKVQRHVAGTLNKCLVRLREHLTIDPDVRISDWEPKLGETVAVVVRIPPARGWGDHLRQAVAQKLRGKGPLVEITYGEQKAPVYNLESDGTAFRALIASTPLDEPGLQKILVRVNDGRHRNYEATAWLQNQDFPTESIWIPDHKVGLRGTDKEMAAVKQLRRRQSPQQSWRLPLLLPCQGEVTTVYGVKRFYNGVFAENYFHQGVDYGADTGTPIVAPAGGRVALVGRESSGFALHGNCVGVDHGQGVVSLLMHLDTVQVRVGAEVAAGQQVGTMGSTGMATGPHLHWGLYVNGKCVDPETWMRPQVWSL